MIAIPVKTNKENTAVSTLFGKAKYFAFIQNNKIEILKNEQTGGRAVANWLKSKNVDTLITSHMGEKPFETLLSNDLKVYFAGDERIEVKDVMVKYADGELAILDSKNFHTLIKEDEDHSKSCSKRMRRIHKMKNKLQKPVNKSVMKNIHF
jgi:predicted Fe-Mo cluster-binding NifX family protein